MDKIDAEGSQLLPLTPDVLTDNWPANDELTIDELTFKIYHTPGHTGAGLPVLLRAAVQRRHAVCRLLRAHGFRGGSMQEMAKASPCWQSCRCRMQQSPSRT